MCMCVRRLRFDVRLLQRVPYEGISRMQTSLRRRHRDRVVRRGSTHTWPSNSLPSICYLASFGAHTPPFLCLRSRDDDRIGRESPTSCHVWTALLHKSNAHVSVFCAQFYATEAGRQHFSDQLTSIRYWYALRTQPLLTSYAI